MILHCWDCGAITEKSYKGIGENLDSCGIFTWCPKCKKYPNNFIENRGMNQIKLNKVPKVQWEKMQLDDDF